MSTNEERVSYEERVTNEEHDVFNVVLSPSFAELVARSERVVNDKLNLDLFLTRMKAISDEHTLIHWDIVDEVTLYAKTITLVTESLERDEDVMFVVGDVIALWYPSLYAVTDSYSHSFDIDLDIQEALVNAGYPEPQEEEDEWADDSSSENEQDEVDESDTDNEVNEDDTDDETYNVVDG